MSENILIIRLGALGDIFLCMKIFQDIRAYYKNARITFLTTPSFAKFAAAMPWFDAVETEPRAPYWRLDEWWKLYKQLTSKKYTLVFDLQNKPRTNLYYQLFFKPFGAKWSGTAKGCELPRPPITQKIHRQQEMISQIRAAGVPDSGPLDLSWLHATLDDVNVPLRYAVFIPGCSPHLLHKRWPPEYYAELAKRLHAKGLEIMVVGTAADAESIAAIKANAAFVMDLSGKTNLHQLASLARGATYVVGNDTGPTFLAAMTGAKTLTLMSHHTDPVLSGPVGPHCAYLKRDNLADLSVDDVLNALVQ